MASNENNDIPEAKPKKDWQYWLKKIKTIFRSPEPQIETANTPTEEPDTLTEMLGTIENEEHIFSFFSLPDKVRPSFKNAIKDMISKGFYDGVAGVRTESFLKLSAAKAKELYSILMGHINGEEKRIETRQTSQTNIASYRKKQMDLHHDYSKYLQHHYKFNERSNTIGEFVMYLILFLVLLLADIPIGVELMKGLFNPDNLIPFSNLFQAGKFAEVLRANWEALLAAIGISVSTIYIKIFYDEFVGSKYGHLVVSKKRFEQLFGIDQKSSQRAEDDQKLTPEEMKEIIRHHRQVKRIKFIILIFTLLAILIVSLFRMYAYDVNSELSSDLEIPKPLLLITMMAVTLLFAIMSGVCLSIALTSLINFKRLKNARRESQLLEKEYLEASNSLAILNQELENTETISRNLLFQNEIEEAIIETLKGYYDLAFNNGRLEPGYFMRKKNFFERILYAREEHIASNINSLLKKQNT